MSMPVDRGLVLMIGKLLRRRYTGQMPTYTFAQLSPQIRTAISQRVQARRFTPDTQLQIIEGFVFMPIQQSVGGTSYQIGGPAMPTVTAVGNNTGKIYYFPLVELIPGINLT